MTTDALIFIVTAIRNEKLFGLWQSCTSQWKVNEHDLNKGPNTGEHHTTILICLN